MPGFTSEFLKPDRLVCIFWEFYACFMPHFRPGFNVLCKLDLHLDFYKIMPGFIKITPALRALHFVQLLLKWNVELHKLSTGGVIHITEKGTI